MRTLIVGDIHACYREFQDLLDCAALGEDDRIIAVGDTVDRGPSPGAVVDFFMDRPNGMSIMGNHERKQLLAQAGKVRPAASQLIARHQIGEESYPGACEFLAGLPLYVDLPDALIVHGFFEPGVPLAEQRETVLVGGMSGERYLERAYPRPWYELYDGEKPIVVGHLNYLGNGQPLLWADRVFCIDTGCYRGGCLTGLLLPDFEIISVPNRENYWRRVGQENAEVAVDAGLAGCNPSALRFTEIEELIRLAEGSGEAPSDASEKLAQLQSDLERGRQAIDLIQQHILAVWSDAQRVLEETHGFATLSEGVQGQLLARHLSDSPVTGDVHRLRRGETPEQLRDRLGRRLESPRKALDLWERLQ